MEKQYISRGLARQADSFKNANCDGYQLVPHQGDRVILQLFCGRLMLFECLYSNEEQVTNDIELLQQAIPGLKRIASPVQDDEPAVEEKAGAGVTLPAGAQIDTETPASIKNQQLQQDINGFGEAALTAYEIGVTTDDKYRLMLYRGNTVAFEYLYPSAADRANDMAVVLDRLPKLTHIGGPEFVS